VLIGLQAKMMLNVDLVVKRAPTGEPTVMQLESVLDMAWPDTWPAVVLYPLADHVADKVCAMYELHERLSGADVPSTRFRDLGDLVGFGILTGLQGLRGSRAALTHLPVMPADHAVRCMCECRHLLLGKVCWLAYRQ
jgi:hypothetical protein